MIDEQWFAIVCCLTGAQISDEMASRLIEVLGVEEEVLPYMLLRTDSFAEWPLARNAFRQAIRSVVRPGAQVGRPAPAPQQRLAVYADFAAATIARIQRAEETPLAAALLRKARLAGAASNADPHVFIASPDTEDGQEKAR